MGCLSGNVRLVCLDFDGTSVVYDAEPAVLAPGVIKCLNELAGQGVRWVTNSGRNLENQLLVLRNSLEAGLREMPAAIMASEALLYFPGDARLSYSDFTDWNAWAREQLVAFHSAFQEKLRPILSKLVEDFQPLEMYIEPLSTVFLIPSENDPDRPVRFHEILQPLAASVPGGASIRNGAWVGGMPTTLGKGSVLARCLEVLGIQPADVAAGGDHLNDLSMLDGLAAGMPFCPSDAHPDVQAQVLSVGGQVAEAAGAGGTEQILRRLLAIR